MRVRSLHSVMVTGGAGFIGSNFIRYLFSLPEFRGRIVNVDKLTYAANPMNLADVEARFGSDRYALETVDICDSERIVRIMEREEIDTVVHFAAESHVDRSILGPREFINTNIVGTFALLEAVRSAWGTRDDVLFHQISTDEVYGSLGAEGQFLETTPYNPRSPYSASKASADHLVRAYRETYGLPATISNCSNNYGPFQFPEKLIPLMILNMIEGKELPVYGSGDNVRDWVHVEDHAAAIWSILSKAEPGSTYNIGGECERKNLEIVEALCELVGRETGSPSARYRALIRLVADRPGHDYRYAVSCEKIKRELDWSPRITLERGLVSTVRWYLDHREWVDSVRTGAYRKWIELNYASRSM